MRKNTVIDTEGQVMRCKVCGEISWVLAVMKAFANAHPESPHLPGRTMLSKGSI